MSKHTPWKVSRGFQASDGPNTVRIVDANGEKIAGPFMEHDPFVATIAAAPELYAACVAVVGVYLCDDNELSLDAPLFARKAYDAIRKVRGEK